MDGFVEVYSKTTGTKHQVPEHWLGHPVLGKNFAETPSTRANKADAPEGDPNETWTRAQLDTHATSLGLDTTSLANKGEVLAAIQGAAPATDPVTDDNGATPNPDDTESPDQTPAAGENQE